MTWTEVVLERVVRVDGGAPLTVPGLGVALAAALALVLVDPLWRGARLAVTLVHELGHALVGLAVGRRFVGFVVRGDMSGHAVTAGPARGAGRVATTWAGYPAPAVLGAALVWLALRGWAAAAVTVALMVLLTTLVRVRSVLTALVMLAAVAGTGALWWWRDDAVQQQVLLAVGLVLLVGAWRHVVAVAGSGTGADDPAALARLTRVPRAVWNASFVLVAAAATLTVAGQLLDVVRPG